MKTKKIIAALLSLALVFSWGSTLSCRGGNSAVITASAGTQEKNIHDLPSEVTPVPSDMCWQTVNEEQSAMYLINGEKLWKYSLEDHTGELAFDFSEKSNYYEEAYLDEVGHMRVLDIYCTQGKVYALIEYNLSAYTEDEQSVVCYDTEKGELTKKTDIGRGRGLTCIGIDGEGRIFASIKREEPDEEDMDSTVIKNYIAVFSDKGEELAKTEVYDHVYDISGFDSSSGKFFFETYFNWVYWGYDHAMHALATGEFKGGELTVSKNLVQTIGQNYFSERHRSAEVIGDKYLVVDAPLSASSDLMNPTSSGVFVYKAAEIGSEDSFVNAYGRSYNIEDTEEFDEDGSVGARAIMGFDNKSIILVTGNKNILEFDPETNDVIAETEASYPVFSLHRCKDKVIAVEKDSENNFYIEEISWNKADTLTLTAEKSKILVGESTKLTAETNGSFNDLISWSSSDSTIASVSENGTVYGRRKGTAVITASTSYGVSGDITIEVEEDKERSQPVYPVSTQGKSSYNVSRNEYNYYASSTVKSYLYEDGSELTRVEAVNGKVIVEKYSADGSKLLSAKEIDFALPIFGGFYSGEKYNYLVFGQQNSEESEDAEILRVVKYSKDWKEMGSSWVKGANTYIPFDAGSLRMTEAGGSLYIHTCHEMFMSEDGKHHQANMTYVFNEDTLDLEQSFFKVMNLSQAGYVSHSFNQFIKTDGTKVYRVDHGDAYPRGIALTSCDVGGDITSVHYTIPMTFIGETGKNYTGAQIGGFELSENNCLIAGKSVDQEVANSRIYNVFVSVSGKDMSDKGTVWLTNYKGEDKNIVSNPQLVSLGSEQFLIMWEENYDYGTPVLKLALLNADGSLASEIVTRRKMRLSDCQPILCSDGIVRWYVTDSSSPVIYGVNPFNLGNIPDPDKIKKGDVNFDKVIDIVDAVLVINNINGVTPFEEAEKLAADINGDNKVDIQDAVAIIAHVNGIKRIE